MKPPGLRSVPVSHVPFDFFGTLVDYSASRTEQGYERGRVSFVLERVLADAV